MKVKGDRFRLETLNRIERPGWKAGLYRSSQHIKKVRLKVEPTKEKLVLVGLLSVGLHSHFQMFVEPGFPAGTQQSLISPS